MVLHLKISGSLRALFGSDFISILMRFLFFVQVQKVVIIVIVITKDERFNVG